MKKYIDADRLRAEIEIRKQVHFDDYFIKNSGNKADYGASNALAQVISLIDSVEKCGIPGKDFIPVEWVDACEQYGKWKIVQQEQPEMDLQKEIDLEWEKCKPTDEGMGLESANIVNEQFDYIARHFYELGLNARKKE